MKGLESIFNNLVRDVYSYSLLLKDQNNGCYAHVGYYQNFGAHTHNLGNGCVQTTVIFHEFGHNVGFTHMHKSQVRNDWVKINFENVEPGKYSIYPIDKLYFRPIICLISHLCQMFANLCSNVKPTEAIIIVQM